jgi:hypothetical protein
MVRARPAGPRHRLLAMLAAAPWTRPGTEVACRTLPSTRPSGPG